jgi:hypothetical protein
VMSRVPTGIPAAVAGDCSVRLLPSVKATSSASTSL